MFVRVMAYLTGIKRCYMQFHFLKRRREAIKHFAPLPFYIFLNRPVVPIAGKLATRLVAAFYIKGGFCFETDHIIYGQYFAGIFESMFIARHDQCNAAGAYDR
jgi:hypothetical protein